MKLHIGCGKKFIPGYKHMDVIDAPHIDYVCNAINLKMIEDDSVEEIYACHILEHVNRIDVLSVLKEWYRVLSVGGVIRIAVPDFEAVVNGYNKDKDLLKYQGLLYGGQDYEYNFHYSAYDYQMLKKLLEEAGFKGVVRYDWKDFLPTGYDDFSRAYMPHMDFDNGSLMSLNVIANKVR